jgi:hypothetical protein
MKSATQDFFIERGFKKEEKRDPMYVLLNEDDAKARQ